MILYLFCIHDYNAAIFYNCLKIAKIISNFSKRNGATCQETIVNLCLAGLLAISKVMERILYTQLNEYFSVNNLLKEHQFGFRKFRVTALVHKYGSRNCLI